MESASRIFLILIFALPLEGVTVNPSRCPTNKIAPHRRIASWNQNRARTFGAFYDLLVPSTNNNNNNHQYNINQQNDNALASLQEQPQEDDPDDCGEIDDYDENDLSSVTQPQRRRQGHSENRFFFGGMFNRPPQFVPGEIQYTTRVPTKPTPVPFRPQKPIYPPTRPPYWSGGFFGNNPYRPPLQQHPSDHLKPVHEHTTEHPVTYWPVIVGGPVGHVVGASPAVPTYPTQQPSNQRGPNHSYIRFPRTTPATLLNNRHTGARRLNDRSIFGSFIDLLF